MFGARHPAGGAGEIPRGVAEALQRRVSPPPQPHLLSRYLKFFMLIFIPAVHSGILVPGGFGVRGTEGKIHAITWARKQKKPFLGEAEILVEQGGVCLQSE